MEGLDFMNAFVCDYACRTVGESIIKHNISDDWCAEFDACDGVYPIICIQVDRICKAPALMDLKLRIVEDPDEEYAGCMIYPDRKTIAFKVDRISDLLKAMETE